MSSVKETKDSVLVLRDIVEDDLPSMVKQANNKKIWKNVRDVFPYPYTIEWAKKWFQYIQDQDHEVILAIDVDGHFVGCIALTFRPDVYLGTAEVGYWIGEDYWGKGIATEAVRQLCKYAFEHFNLRKIEGRVFGWNPASKRVLEKVGFKEEGLIREAIIKDNEVTDEYILGLIPSEVILK